METVKSKNGRLILLFGSFMLLQLIILRLGNQSGRGYLTENIQELVYYAIQAVVIFGYFAHAAVRRLMRKHKGYEAVVAAIVAADAAGAEAMLFLPCGSLSYIIVSGFSVLLLGFLVGAVYSRMSEMIADGARAGISIGVGYSSAIVLQYLFQLQWTLTPVLAVLLAASAAFLICLLLIGKERKDIHVQREVGTADFAKPLIAAVITIALLLFVTYYNSFIHHLQVVSGYTDYNVYSWPRLLMIPAVILFGVIGDLKGGRFQPICTICVAVVALLNALLIGQETYLLNMCLYYLSLSAVVSYYHTTFLRLAPTTRHPVLWAGAGRVLDSVNVLFSLLFMFSQMSSVAVVMIDIVALVVIVVMMAFSGEFDLSLHSRSPEKEEQGPEPADIGEPVPAADPFEVICERYGFTPAELRVFRELVLTEDKQAVIGDHLSIKLRTVQANVTSIYRKTGLNTRSGLVQLYNDSIHQN